MTKMTITLDAGDRKILRELQRNARLSNIDLAARVGMSPSTCLRRTRALEEAGIISAYVAVVDPAALGPSISLYIMIDLDQRIETDARMFFDRIARDDRIVECVALTGNHDILIRAVVRDMADMAQLTMDTLLKLPSVRSITSSIVMRPIKRAASRSDLF
ncbi:Lrp/AsnC family transcriptional regulator [Sphingosinicella sp.]|jgi:Lrp/AsnC family leucine-responsive transcriptional regulator|uniref:Lrp/AsnC family transcriptional regulator n=1 Tax=Sphingosinicella sp. TaxID=1917971 RepID=UPI00262A2470|nr:Lrp/AsnC family transcriptional regulator [Sphingosinicella sp.]MEA3539157.1 Lrp/AsnC family transcriptional regulator [Pseudomonadota bacterium]